MPLDRHRYYWPGRDPTLPIMSLHVFITIVAVFSQAGIGRSKFERLSIIYAHEFICRYS